MSTTDRLRVKSAGTMFAVVDALQELDHPSVADVADRVGVPKSTAHDHLSTLEELDFVVKESEGYRIGARFLEYGGCARENMKVYRVARPVVKRLAEETGEHANLMIEEHGLGVFLYKAKGENAVTLDTRPGMRVPLQTTALGKAILAHTPREEVERILEEHGMPNVTEKTVTDPELLFEELAEVRERGYATDDEERVAGMRCIAAPVLDRNDEILGAVSVSGPMSRMNDERYQDDIPRSVKSAANVIEVNMTYS
ncbi:IclR family transcriptional regulator [Halopelagius longus]|uniref:IclR family transcriptional regulator n=1 Tax=Halopelagius longus TaxID=1236180 RepID=A0A1H0XN56_9EURY|nr:IclR family transcriptional regulator [Halopelagius longus]RDI71949.1 IclR family transcriptional regulator [Halopelagius longus]SDQ04368.1 transcriptional regulator, IclR family [Halopelagius longus]